MPAPIDREDSDRDDREVDEIVGRGPSGAFAVAGIATRSSSRSTSRFYFFIYLPRGAVQ